MNPQSPQNHGHQTEVAPGVRVQNSALRFEFIRAQGPGGQNVNKRSSRARLRISIQDLPLPPDQITRLLRIAAPWLVGQHPDNEIVIASGIHRTQRRNRAECLDRLAALIIKSKKRPKPRTPTKPTRGAVERRLKAKRVRADAKQRRKPNLD